MRLVFFFDNKPVIVLRGINDESDFGIILHQEKFLAYLYDALLKKSNFEGSMGVTAKEFKETNGSFSAVLVKNKIANYEIESDIFVVTTGRGSLFRKDLELSARKITSHWNILWILLPKPEDSELVPDGFRAFLNGKSLFIMYATHDGKIQMAWGRRDEKSLKLRNHEEKRKTLLSEIPASYRPFIENGFTAETKTQFLKVHANRLGKWYKKNILFLGGCRPRYDSSCWTRN